MQNEWVSAFIAGLCVCARMHFFFWSYSNVLDFCLISFITLLFFRSLSFFSNERQKGTDLNERGGGEELGVEGGKTKNRIYYCREILF